MSNNRGSQQALDPTLRSVESQEFQAALRSKVVGQEEGVRALVDLYQVFCAGMCSIGRPVGNLLFLGPTGSGKTRIVEAAAEIFFGDPRAVIDQIVDEVSVRVNAPRAAHEREGHERFTVDRVIAEEARSGDLVVCLGAGDITAWAYALPDQLEALA